MSTESTLTSRGQVTIPKSIRERLGIKPGNRMSFTLMLDRTVLLRVRNRSAMSPVGSARTKGRTDKPVEALSRRSSS